MDRYEIIGELEQLIGAYLKEQRLVLVELLYRHEGSDLFLRILVDKPEGGIILEECGRLNRELGALLEEKDILKERYILEVASPGLDRPLKTKADFMRCLKREVRFFLSEPVGGKIELAGVTEKVENDSVFVAQGMGVLEIPLTKINKAKQII